MKRSPATPLSPPPRPHPISTAPGIDPYQTLITTPTITPLHPPSLYSISPTLALRPLHYTAMTLGPYHSEGGPPPPPASPPPLHYTPFHQHWHHLRFPAPILRPLHHTTVTMLPRHSGGGPLPPTASTPPLPLHSTILHFTKIGTASPTPHNNGTATTP